MVGSNGLPPWVGCAASSLVALAVAGCGPDICDDAEPVDEIGVGSCNHRPTAQVNVAARVRAARNESLLLDASSSIDLDGAALTYTWTLVQGASDATLTGADTPKATFVARELGTYGVQLVVNDGELDSDPLLVQIEVLNTPPIAEAGPDVGVAVGGLATLDGLESADPEGDALTYQWRFESRPAGSAAALDDPSSAQPSFTVDVEGIYTLALVVSDYEADSAPDYVRVGGGIAGSPPVADAGPDTQALLGQTFTFEAAGSVDPDGSRLSYAWRWVEIPELSEVPELTPSAVTQASFRPDVTGLYVAELVVSDGFYTSAPDTIEITVVPGTGQAGDLCEVAGCEAGTACFDGVCVGVGRLRFSLSWTVYSDFDLHVQTPAGVEIYFANPVDGGGELDVDDCVGNNCLSTVHVENIVFQQVPPSGRYDVWVVNYNGGGAGDFRIDVFGAARDQFSGSLPATSGAMSRRFQVFVP